MSSYSARSSTFMRVREFLQNIKMSHNAHFKVVLYTALGRIVCDIEPPAEKDSLLGITDYPDLFTVDISAAFDEKSEADSNLLNARNVIVYNSAGEESMRVDQMLIFADRIIGFGLERGE